MAMTNMDTLAGEFQLIWQEGSHWQGKLEKEILAEGVEEITLSLSGETAEVPTVVEVRMYIPQRDIYCRWSTYSTQVLRPNWSDRLSSCLTRHAPTFTLLGKDGNNRFTLSCSEASREVVFSSGLREEDSVLECYFKIFTFAEAPLKDYTAKIRIDARNIFYADAVRESFDWFATFDAYKPAVAPAASRDLLYSSWYSYHKQGLYAETIEKQILEAKKYGMKTLIVDDGWQCDNYDGGSYAYCGDWEPVERRFPDMAAHVKKVHDAGFKYILWYSVPFMGQNAKLFKHFEGKYLANVSNGLGAYVLDPRFPDVREYLINTYEHAMKEWDLDGFKLDFIDSFGYIKTDPAVEQDYAGRDCKTVAEGVDKLMSAVMERLKAIKSDVLIEFRQSYMGPGIRKFGNIIRAGDCPSDCWSNRSRTTDLRLSSGNTTVHSDMLSWNYNESAESAARQFIAILFSVPQISVRLEEIPESHQKMLKFWCEYWLENRSVLLDGCFKPCAPELLYPLILSEKDGKVIAVVHSREIAADLHDSKAEAFDIVNGTDTEELIVDLPAATEGITKNVFGETVEKITLPAGLSRVRIPVSGILMLKKR